MSKNAFDWSKWLPILISGAALVISIIAIYWNIISERARSKAQLEVWQRNTFYHGSNDDRTKITLLFRNLSHRPTAIVDIYIREGEGSLCIIERDKIGLPITIDPWGVREVEFRIEQNDEKRMNNILVRDIEDNEIILIRGTGETWVKEKSNNK